VLIYSCVLAFILFLAIYSLKEKYIDSNGVIQYKMNSLVVIIASFVVLFCISSFRGDFTSDYKNYRDQFLYYSKFTVYEVLGSPRLRGQELGYVLLNILTYQLGGSYVAFVSEISFLTLLFFYKGFWNDSDDVWLSIIMFVSIGAYYTSFNISRQILAVSMTFWGAKYLYDRKAGKYFIIVLLASLFHRTALILIPFYFVLNMDLNWKSVTLVTLCTIGLVVALDEVLDLVRFYVYSAYRNDSYGMTGLKVTNIVLPAVVAMLGLLLRKEIQEPDKKDKIWINATLFYLIFSLLGLKVMMLQRFAEYFMPFSILLLTRMFCRVKPKEFRLFFIFLFVIGFCLYNLVTLSSSGYNPYYFIKAIK